MEPDTSKKHSIHYVQQELPNRLFAIVRMEWRSEYGVETVDEVKLIDEGTDTIAGFAELMQKAIEGGADLTHRGNLPDFLDPFLDIARGEHQAGQLESTQRSEILDR